MSVNYSIEMNVQIIIALMKAHGIRKVIASPGSTNICLVASLQNDKWFEVYSSVDERSAAYLACGLASESGEPVALTCTEATASRNYLSGLTEAYYRKLPILAITATNRKTLIGQNHPQMIDRSITPRDVVKKSLFVPYIHDNAEKIGYEVLINDAILELKKDGGGPVHIEFETKYSTDYSILSLPEVNVIKRVTLENDFPNLKCGKIAIYVGAHKKWDEKLTNLVDIFCEKYDAVVLVDRIGNYNGKYGVNFTTITSQYLMDYDICDINTLIYIGDISSAYRKNIRVKNTWRVNLDGEIRNVFGNTKYVFEMSELQFFEHYASIEKAKSKMGYFNEWKSLNEKLMNKIPELPFSNLYVASRVSKILPSNIVLYLGIENSLRSWNFFEPSNSYTGFCNTGGFGIDGGVSSLIGASFADKKKLYFGVTGDLAFFYDMNVLGNKHIGNNVRLIVINNGLGQQFKNPDNLAYVLADSANDFVAAAGHNGDKSKILLKHYAEDLGFKYLCASNKTEFDAVIGDFIDVKSYEKSIVFEIFTDSLDETKALQLMQTLECSAKSYLKKAIKKVIGK